ncbi:MaoC family dehydratase [Aquisalimonas lutea]|uniref:MaoC family dehydratase n=1 Tax=Aquisalimonas lutea TaxID=1327750 RepID=UPI0025B3E338|nr:MaoC family dehydratase [Aquisalimonas lutea]MDN3518797.1 MaoC family dehydratase [Aquisalimonas lutea]
MLVVDGIEEIKALGGRDLGVTDWVTVDQERINAFAEATGDHQWIHVDEERCRRESPYGTTIAHGFLTISLLPMLAQQLIEFRGISARLNYGLNKLRFTGPVPAGSRVRLRQTIKDVSERDDGSLQVTADVVIEVEGTDKPACIAESVALCLP